MFKMSTDSGGHQQRITSPFNYELGVKNLLHPAPCYILEEISRESIRIGSQPCSLVEIQWNPSIGKSRSRAKESRAELSQTGLNFPNVLAPNTFRYGI
jgi:hypothetical protein